MTLYILKKRIEKEYISEVFEEEDLEYAINEANAFFQDGNRRVGDVTESLLASLIENPPNNRYKYSLTSHAFRFLEFLGKKLFNEHTHFPLKETFQNYGLFKAEDMYDVKKLESWYEFNFKNSSKSTIEDHLEGFKDLVNNSILKLNSLTTNNEELAIKNLDEFVSVFKEIVSREGEIREIIYLSGTLKSEIRKVVIYFESLMQGIQNENEDKSRSEVLLKDYELVLEIRSQVFGFFNHIETRLEQIFERYLYADKQLSYYKESFRNRSRFQLNLKAFLGYSLEQVCYNKKEGLSFGANYPIKAYPQEKVKLIYPFYYETFAKKISRVIPTINDKEYEKEQLAIANNKLLKQEEVALLVQTYKDEIAQTKCLDLTTIFYAILEKSNDSDIALKVVHRLIQFAGEQSNYSLTISQELVPRFLENNILLWKMNIQVK